MSIDVTQFNKTLQKEAEVVNNQMLQFYQKVAFQVLSGVVKRTPVDTGRARGNWQVSIAKSVDGVIGRESPGAVVPVISGADGATMEAGLIAINSSQDFASIFIVNNVPYILPLNEGHSTQIPAGFVELTLTEVEAQFK